jgi:hypothetical protein
LKTRMHPSNSVVIYRRRMEKDVPVLPRSQRRKMGIICIDIFFVSLVFFVCMLLVFKESFFFFLNAGGLNPGPPA